MGVVGLDVSHQNVNLGTVDRSLRVSPLYGLDFIPLACVINSCVSSFNLNFVHRSGGIHDDTILRSPWRYRQKRHEAALHRLDKERVLEQSTRIYTSAIHTLRFAKLYAVVW